MDGSLQVGPAGLCNAGFAGAVGAGATGLMYCDGNMWNSVVPPDCWTGANLVRQNGVVFCLNSTTVGIQNPFASSIFISPLQGMQINRWTGDPYKNWTLCFRRSRDGSSLAQMYANCGGKGGGMVMLCRNPSTNPVKYFGFYSDMNINSLNVNGQRKATNVFLFNVQPAVKKYPWVVNGYANYINTGTWALYGIYQTTSYFGVGGYTGGYSQGEFVFDANMNHYATYFPFNFMCNGNTLTTDAAICIPEFTGVVGNVGASGQLALDDLEVYYENKNF